MGKKIRKSWLSILVMCFALTGWLNFAEAATASYLATNMTKTTGGAITISGLSSWNIWSNGSIYAMVPIATTGSYNITVKAYGQAAAGVNPNMDILVDGVKVKSFSVAANTFSDYTVAANINAGTRKIEIKFTNDYYASGADRNLIVYNMNVASNSTTSPSPSPSPTSTSVSAPPVSSTAAIVSSSLSKTSLAAGDALTSIVNLSSNTQVSGLIVDIRVYKSGTETQVAKKTFEPVSLSAGALTTLRYDIATSGFALGKYDIRVGIWNSSWATLAYEQRESFSIVSGTVTSPSPTPTPTQLSQSADGTLLPPATQIVDSSLAKWTLSGGVVYRNGALAGYSANVVLLIYKNSRVYQQNSAGGFWYWDGSSWVGTTDPRGSTSPSPSPTPTSTGTSSTTVSTAKVSSSAFSMNCNESTILSAGSYNVENNMWGKDGVYGSYSQCIGIRGNADGSTSARWTWSWPDGPNEVKGYPAIVYGQKPGYQKTPGSGLPIRLDQAQTILTSWAEHSTYTGRGHLSYDLWLARDGNFHAGFNNNPLTHEIMIPAEPYGGYGLDRNPAWYIRDVTISGIPYKLYKADGFGTIGWRFIVLQPQGPMLVYQNLDWKPIFAYLKSAGLIGGYEYLVSIEFGTEVQYGTGDVIIDAFKATVK